MPPSREALVNRGDEDGKFTPSDYESGAQADHALYRGLPRLQILAVLEPGHAIPYQSRMLPQNVRIVRGQDILFRARELPRSGVPQDTEKEPISQADIRGY